MPLPCPEVTIEVFFHVRGSVHRKYIPIYIQQDATLHSLFYLKTALHVSGGTSTHHQELIQLYLQHLLFVRPLLLPAATVEELEPVPTLPRGRVRTEFQFFHDRRVS